MRSVLDLDPVRRTAAALERVDEHSVRPAAGGAARDWRCPSIAVGRADPRRRIRPLAWVRYKRCGWNLNSALTIQVTVLAELSGRLKRLGVDAASQVRTCQSRRNVLSAAERMRPYIVTKVVRPARPAPAESASKTTTPPIPDSFDVAISFAGTEREQAQKLAEQLRDAGYAVSTMTFIRNSCGERI